MQLDLLDEPIKLVTCDPVAGCEESCARAQECNGRLHSQSDVVLYLLDRFLEAALVLFVRDFGEVIVSENSEAEAQQENQIGQEDTTLA